MFLAIPVVLKCHNMEIAKAGWQLSHRNHTNTDLISTQAFAFMISFCGEEHIKFLMHCRCHIHLMNWYFNSTPPSSPFSTSINFKGMALSLSKPGPDARVGADSPPKIIGAT